MKKLIATTAIAIAIAGSGYFAYEHQVEQLRYEYNVQLNQENKEIGGLKETIDNISKSYQKIKKDNENLQTDNKNKDQQIQQQQQQIQSQSDEINKLKKQIDESPRRNWMTFSASAYTVGDAYTSGAWGNKTASGTVPTQGRTIAVDPNLIPLGTKLEVQFPEPYSYLNGTYVAEDTGSAIHGHKVDLYLNSVSQCLNFGVKDIKINIIN